MKHSNFAKLIVIFGFANAALFAGAAESAAFKPSPEEQQVVNLTNQEREQRGLPALAINPALTISARDHAKNMAAAQTLAHTLNGSSMTSRIKGSGYQYLAIGENVAFNQPTPESVVQSWMESPGHRANILNKTFTEIGVGVANDADGKPYYAQDFGRPVSAGPTESAKFSITNQTKDTATVVLPGSTNKSLLDPGATGEYGVAGTEKLPPVKISIGEKTETLNFEDGGAYMVKDSADGLKIQSETAR